MTVIGYKKVRTCTERKDGYNRRRREAGCFKIQKQKGKIKQVPRI